MKKFALLFFVAVAALAARGEAAMKFVECPQVPLFSGTVSVTTSTLATIDNSSYDAAIGIYLTNPASNAAAIVGYADTDATGLYASTVRPIEAGPGEDKFYPYGDDTYVHLLSLGSATQSLHYTVVKCRE